MYEAIYSVVGKIEDDGHRRKYLEYLRDYHVIPRTKVDEIAMMYGLKYHKESNLYWWF